jgi:hypothetical protein
VLEAGRRNLLIVMAEAPMASGVSRFRAFIWKPALAAFVVVVFVAVSGAGAVYASQGALPGDSLYAVKLASESVQERLTLSPEAKFAVQAAHATERLEETQELMRRNGLDAEERQERVQRALQGFERRVTVMDGIAGRMAAAPSKKSGKGRGLKTMLAAERLLDRHAELVKSATEENPDLAQDVIAPIEDSIKLESDVYAFAHRTHRDDGGTDDATGTQEDPWEKLRQERNARLSEYLKQQRDGQHAKTP